MRKIASHLAAAAVGASFAVAAGLSYIEVYRVDLVNRWIGDRSIIANVDMSISCDAAVCMRGPDKLILGVRGEARYGHDAVQLIDSARAVLRDSNAKD